MQIEVRTYGTARFVLGDKQLTICIDDGATIEDVLADLTEDSDIDPNDLVVMKNGIHAQQLSSEATPLEDGDQLVLADTIDE
ncbi:MoaD/ThiS family protein [Haladaptatus caseinilyticus]|uniref:MoaD/ThiS family protein n=1 Tax=Haladaptatus caseinilyticus TaxID=2993314 RepID=UPI00224B14A1|nr:MoaD/ThiS family protein [Haladaptatus caseinilyticus]